MTDYTSINAFLCENTDAKRSDIVNNSYSVNGLSIEKLRDILIKIGDISIEDKENNTYIAVIPGGFLKKNYSSVAIELSNNELVVAAFSNEGIINQHTTDGVIDEIERSISEYLS